MTISFSNYTGYSEIRFNNFVTCVTNLISFLPYFFSVKHLLKTFFSPWKNITEQKKGGSTSLNDTVSRISFNVISRFIGAWIRGSVIFMYVIVQILVVLLLPIIFTLYILLSPLLYILSETIHKIDDKEIEESEQTAFIHAHTLNPKNENLVLAWYSNVIKPTSIKKQWYDRERLFSIVPIGRNWTTGYTPLMDLFCTSDFNFSQNGHLIGRTEILQTIEQTLIQNNKANLLLVGIEGVGRDTIIEDLAHRIYYGKTNPLLAYKRIVTIDIDSILSSSPDSIIRKQTLASIFNEAHGAGNIILVIHDLQKYTSTYENHIDIADVLERYASSERVHIIATTTPSAYQKYVSPNDKIRELFVKLDIPELSLPLSLDVLLYLAPQYEKRYNVIIPFETLLEANIKAHAFLSKLPLPESAIHLLDDVCALRQNQSDKTITPEMIQQKLESELHIPTEVTTDLKNALLVLEERLNKEIINQQQATKAITDTLTNSFVSGNRQGKPLATFLFLGPTGVGKTETAKALARVFFEDADSLIRLDMGNYQTKQDISALLGDSHNPGLLTTQIGNKPYGVLLLDEIEKALPDLLHIFLTVLDEGYFVNGRGDRVLCNNLVVIATSNAGSNVIYSHITKNQTITSNELLRTLVDNKLYTPEFLNRFDGVIMFAPLSNIAITVIAKQLLEKLDRDIFEKHGIHVVVSSATLTKLIEKGYDPEFGARDIQRVIKSEIETIVSNEILNGKNQKGTSIHI